MPAEATMKVVVLYEDEVRTAAKAIDQVRELMAADGTAEGALDEAWTRKDEK
jgi:hypothetical protein